MDHLNRLRNLVPPHGSAVPDPDNWHDLERQMGISFPEDYVQFMNEYGGGTFCSLVEIPDPFQAPLRYGKSTEEWWTSWSGIFTCWGEESDLTLPFPLFPAVPGLLPWGTYSDENVLGWVTAPRKNDWHIVYKDMRRGFIELQQYGFAEFLVNCIERTLPKSISHLFEKLAKQDRAFEEYRVGK